MLSLLVIATTHGSPKDITIGSRIGSFFRSITPMIPLIDAANQRPTKKRNRRQRIHKRHPQKPHYRQGTIFGSATSWLFAEHRRKQLTRVKQNTSADFLQPCVVQANLMNGPARSFYMPLKNVGLTYEKSYSAKTGYSAAVHYYDPIGSVQEDLRRFLQHSHGKPEAPNAPFSRFVASSGPIQCSSRTPGRTVHLHVCQSNNCFLANFGHLHINVIEVLADAFRHTYPDLLNVRKPRQQNARVTAFLYGMKTHDEGKFTPRRTPVYLFDVLERIFDETIFVGVDAEPAIDDKRVHCYDQLLYVAENWSSRMYVLAGRFGRRQYYRGFGMMMKSFVLSQYGLGLEAPPGDNASPKRINAVWLHRPVGGQGSARDDDTNTTKIASVFTGSGFNFTLLTTADFVWEANKLLRGHRVTRLLRVLQSADVAIGVWGANLWNALYLKAGAMLVELKVSAGYFNNENGRSIANMMNLHLHMSDVRNYQFAGTPLLPGGLRYPLWYLRRLATEIRGAYHAHQAAAYGFNSTNRSNTSTSGSSSQARMDAAMNEWSGECLFRWPESKAPSLARENVTVLTSVTQSRCYVDRTELGWYQRLASTFDCDTQAMEECLDNSSWSTLQKKWAARTYPCLEGEPCPGCPWLC